MMSFTVLSICDAVVAAALSFIVVISPGDVEAHSCVTFTQMNSQRASDPKVIYTDASWRITVDEMEGDILVRDTRGATQCFTNIASVGEGMQVHGAQR